MTKTCLVYGLNSNAREERIAALLKPGESTAVIAEGIANGNSKLEATRNAHDIQLIRIAPGCPCCSGNLTMRVTLNRLLRKPPHSLYISLASNEHVQTVRDFLQTPQYKDLLTLQEDCNCENPD